ncbi:MAG: hypothetical protein ACRC4W_03065 [Treponemataceae bacterium]
MFYCSKKSLIFVALLILFFGCKKNTDTQINIATKQDKSPVDESKTHQWFYFSKNNVIEIDSLQRLPLVEQLPWTEAIRISGATHTANQAYFLVNKLGLFSMPANQGEQIIRFTDNLFFPNFTADTLLSVDENPVFKIYKNNFFNLESEQTSFPFLLQYNSDTNTVYPLLSNKDIDLADTTQAVDLFFDGKTWTGAFKYIANERVLFDYIQFSSYKSLVELKNIAKTGKIEKKYISSDTYKQIAGPKPFASAPIPLVKMLENVRLVQPFLLSYTESNSQSPILYANKISENDVYMQAKAFFGKTFLLSVFSDGTAYFLGSLPQNPKNILDDVTAFKLPKLPENFVYGDILCFGKMLYVAWEESFFYETGRSGFIAVNLENLLFNK